MSTEQPQPSTALGRKLLEWEPRVKCCPALVLRRGVTGCNSQVYVDVFLAFDR